MSIYKIGDRVAQLNGKPILTVEAIETKAAATFYLLSNGKEYNEHQLIDNADYKRRRKSNKGQT